MFIFRIRTHNTYREKLIKVKSKEKQSNKRKIHPWNLNEDTILKRNILHLHVVFRLQFKYNTANLNRH